MGSRPAVGSRRGRGGPIRPRMYDRAVLILDGAGHPLGELSLTLITLGLRPLYTTELDELVLLSREYRSDVGAVLVPNEDVARVLPGLRKNVLEPLELPLAALVPVGERPGTELLESLRAEGVRYRLPTEPEAHELRFVVANAGVPIESGERRGEPRVPCHLPVSVESAEQGTVDGDLEEISPGGAFVSLARPFAEETEVRLLFVLPNHPAALRARVTWRVDARTPAWRERGMGVDFLEPDEATVTVLERFVEQRAERLRL